jgi:hypothetical protein
LKEAKLKKLLFQRLSSHSDKGINYSKDIEKKFKREEA